jgi:hypothetical protein
MATSPKPNPTKPLATNHGNAAPPSPWAMGLKCAQQPNKRVATAMRVTFAAAPPTRRADRAAQIAELLQSSMVRIPGNMRGSDLSDQAVRVKLHAALLA